MPEEQLVAEIRQLAQALALTEHEDVRDSADILIGKYRGRVQMIHALDDMDRMSQDDMAAVEQRLQDRLRKAREDLRAGLKRLLEWARRTGRMPPA